MNLDVSHHLLVGCLLYINDEKRPWRIHDITVKPAEVPHSRAFDFRIGPVPRVSITRRHREQATSTLTIILRENETPTEEDDCIRFREDDTGVHIRIMCSAENRTYFFAA